ncbi:MAG: hypothetical protein E7606_02785 [Ruminococcaceae bacterium]|nr:hypothetical protein [Oscillospiraceae bacterium]
MADYRFKKGDFVVYGTSGVCQIEEVGELTFGALTNCYYTLRPTSDLSSLTYVPCDNETLTAKLRPLLTPKEIETLLGTPLDCEILFDNDRKVRLAAFREILSNGDPVALLAMIRCILLKQRDFEKVNRGLSLSDNDILRTAIFIINSEFSFVLGIPKESVADYIRSKLSPDERI